MKNLFKFNGLSEEEQAVFIKTLSDKEKMEFAKELEVFFLDFKVAVDKFWAGQHEFNIRLKELVEHINHVANPTKSGLCIALKEALESWRTNC